MQHFRSIQALRAVAALLVVGHHLLGKFGVGAAGVDVFFVISGFIMGTIGVRESPGQFVLKRICRIVPLYWLVTLMMCAGALLGVFTRFSFDSATLLKSLFFIPYFDPSGQIWPLVVPAWTLNVEMLFYVVFALSLLTNAAVWVATALLMALMAVGMILHPESAALKLWTTPLLIEFIVGLLLATVIKPRNAPTGLAMILAGVAGLIWAGMSWRFDDSWRALVWGLPASLIVCGALTIERAGRWPKIGLRWLERIGDSSYSLYLTHGLVIAFMHRRLGSSVPVNALTLLISIGVGFAFYHGFERPVGAWLSRLTSTRKRPAKTALPDSILR